MAVPPVSDITAHQQLVLMRLAELLHENVGLLKYIGTIYIYIYMYIQYIYMGGHAVA
jgi:hypothetical protein